ncbi:heme biosynthesis protein HemY [Shewanella sp. JM162201]|uniref:Heme biosynthesis protein HemY n=1 Tax=Shewanella jiangmenensis TaxID=2837387 RepID=A0ABS5V7X6_9GAMM|nr:heme biosynthesis HemY N-terminal domain-containing protein [Shewanella jiangmenensis]MBT1446544.1 heme biosynthesis protein HemY [Shewanella jiangmenensis]
MIRPLIYLGIVLAGLCLSPYLIGNTGYLYLAAGDYELETSLVFAGIMLVVGYLLFTLAERLVRWLLRVIFGSRYLPERWRRNAAKRHTLSGALALAEEDWPDAEHFMTKGANKGELPALNLLAAARAAQRQGKYAERDGYLDRAAKEPMAELAVMTSRTRYLLQQGQLERAREILDKLQPSSKSKAPVVKLALDVYQAQQDWPALRELLPAIRKQAVLSEVQLGLLTQKININLLQRAANQSLEALEKEWQWLSRSDKQHSANLATYALGLGKLGKREEALKLLLKDINTHAEAAVLDALPRVISADDTQALTQLAKLGGRYDDVPEYHKCMATLCLQSRDFKAAHTHLQKACELDPARENWLALATLNEQLGETAMALSHYRKAAMA